MLTHRRERKSRPLRLRKTLIGCSKCRFNIGHVCCGNCGSDGSPWVWITGWIHVTVRTSARELRVSSGQLRALTVPPPPFFLRDQRNAPIEALNELTRPVKQYRGFDVIRSWREDQSRSFQMISGKHFKAHEVSCCIKYFIFGFNIIFWFLGVAFLGIGLWAWSEKGVLSNISSITDLGGFDPVWLFLVVGGVMFILGFAGCIGALRENSFLLKFFSVFLGIIFFLELTAGVLAFVFKDWIKDQLNFFINNNIRAYRDDIDLQNLIDFTQEYWECCGAFGADDWNLNIYFNCTDSNPSREKCGVPFSCCTKDPAEDVINTQCGYDIRAKTDSEQRTFIYIKGCVPQFEKWLQDNLTVVAGIFIGIALLQIFGICLAQNLVSDIDAVRESCLYT
ncbi:tetraspanin-5 isoform X1 [Oryzias latipes]